MISIRTAVFGSALAAAALVAVAGCSREADKASRSLAEDTAATAPPSQLERVSRSYRSETAPAGRTSRARDDGAATGWATSRRGSADQNARRQFERNGPDFGAASLEDYVAKARDFAAHPPRGSLTANRANGDRLYYDPRSNIFLAADRQGEPRTMFKPREGRAYWTQQQQRLADDRTSGRSGTRASSRSNEGAAG